MVGLEDDPFRLGPFVTFQGRTVKLREGTPLKINMEPKKAPN